MSVLFAPNSHVPHWSESVVLQTNPIPISSTRKSLGVLEPGLNLASDAMEGQNVKQAAKSRLKSTGQNLLQKISSTRKSLGVLEPFLTEDVFRCVP
jgi:hypothetical protein